MVDWWQQESLIKLESPTSIFIVAPSISGKTVLAKNILKHVDGMLKIPPTKICFCYTVYQPLYDEMKKEIPLIEFHQGLPTMDTLTEWGAIHDHNIVVLDDLK